MTPYAAILPTQVPDLLQDIRALLRLATLHSALSLYLYLLYVRACLQS